MYKKIVASVLVILTICFFWHFLMMLTNELFGIFLEKQAGLKAIDLYATGEYVTDFNNKWLVQALLNTIPLELLGSRGEVLIITNRFLITLSGLLFHYYFYVYKKCNRAANLVFLLMVFFPTSIYYSFFGIRDSVLFFFVTLLIFSLLLIYETKIKIQYILLLFISIYSIASIRLEFLILIPIYIFYKSYFLARDNKRHAILFFILVVTFIFSITNYSEIIFSKFSNDMYDFVNVYAENRYNRQFKGSGNTAVLSQDIYSSLSRPSIVAVQIIGMFVIPVPWLLTSIPMFLAFIDTLILGGIFVKLKRNLRFSGKLDRAQSLVLLFVFVSTLLIFGLVVSNSGNALRMRFPLIPFAIIAYGIVYSNTIKKRELHG